MGLKNGSDPFVICRNLGGTNKKPGLTRFFPVVLAVGYKF
jgi:hypothetical protein